jgi:hypothetical protein
MREEYPEFLVSTVEGFYAKHNPDEARAKTLRFLRREVKAYAEEMTARAVREAQGIRPFPANPARYWGGPKVRIEPI